MEKAHREELLTEYYKLIDMVQGYDAHFLSIKNWSVTLSSAAIGLGYLQGTAPIFFIAFFLSIGFWLTEARYKVLQLNHMRRVLDIEEAFKTNAEIATPGILGTFRKQSGKNQTENRMIRVLFWSQVMFPHLFFTVISAAAVFFQAYYR